MTPPEESHQVLLDASLERCSGHVPILVVTKALDKTALMDRECCLLAKNRQNISGRALAVNCSYRPLAKVAGSMEGKDCKGENSE